MQRGMLTLTRNQLYELAVRMQIKKQKGTNLYNKMLSAWQSNNPVVRIEVSADELDKMYDAVGIPDANDTDVVRGLRKSINNLIYHFNEEQSNG